MGARLHETARTAFTLSGDYTHMQRTLSPLTDGRHSSPLHGMAYPSTWHILVRALRHGLPGSRLPRLITAPRLSPPPPLIPPARSPTLKRSFSLHMYPHRSGFLLFGALLYLIGAHLPPARMIFHCLQAYLIFATPGRFGTDRLPC